ncbi:FCD domain-containing protein [Xanthobacter sp. DSM 24535]|uniref:FCD domain-containing protein n=1 Tax=Roseixanthobacter psychrophilus TaxID=3119917 RepID=UPI0037279CFE
MAEAEDALSAIAQRRTQSLTDIVRKELERMILSGEIGAGERINEQALATQLGVSRGPIREATRALEHAGLVTSVVNHGSFVRAIEAEEAAEIYDLRAVLFGFACSRLAAHISAEQEAVLEDLLAQMDTAAKKNKGTLYYQLNLRFHEQVMNFCGHRRLKETYQSLLKEMHLVRQRSLMSQARMRESNAEHAALLVAMAAGDVGRARELGEAHAQGGKRRSLEAGL